MNMSAGFVSCPGLSPAKPRSSFGYIFNSLFHRGGQAYPGPLGIFEEGTQNPKGHCMVIPSVTTLPVGTGGRRNSSLPVSGLPSGREHVRCAHIRDCHPCLGLLLFSFHAEKRT